MGTTPRTYQEQLSEEDVEHWLRHPVTQRMIEFALAEAESQKDSAVSAMLDTDGAKVDRALQHAHANFAWTALAEVVSDKASAMDFLGLEG